MGKTNEDFVKRVEMHILIKVLFDHGIPMEKLLPDTGRKRGRKGKKLATEETPENVPVVERTRENPTEVEVC